MIRTLLKHHIYEFCLFVCFDRLEKNLSNYDALLPMVGDKFSKIVDTFSGDSFIDCTVIDVTELCYWWDLDVEESKNIAFAIRFRTWVDSSGQIQSDMGEYNTIYDELHFDRYNFITLKFHK